MTYRLHPNEQHEVLFPRTLPVRTMDDLAPYHWHMDPGTGKRSLRKGPPPKAVQEATAAFADGTMTLGRMLDSLGVPKAQR